MQRETEWISNLKTVDIEEQTAMFEDNAENNGIKSTNDYLKNAHKSFKGINVPAGADTNSFDRACVLCKDRIEVVWDHEQDEWVYPNVVKISNQEVSFFISIPF